MTDAGDGGAAPPSPVSGCVPTTTADPVAAILLCHTDRVHYSFANGRKVVDEGQPVTVDYERLTEQARAAALRLAS